MSAHFAQTLFQTSLHFFTICLDKEAIYYNKKKPGRVTQNDVHTTYVHMHMTGCSEHVQSLWTLYPTLGII